MLFYKPPFLMVDNVTVFPDHEDPQTFYFIASVPEFVKEDGQPAFWAVAILPQVNVMGAGGTGVAVSDISRANISFDAQLTATPEQLENVRKEIQKQRGIEVKQLNPAPFESGKVTLTVARPGADQPSKDISVFDGHPPTLVGDNRAAVAVSAQADEAKMLIASLSVGSLAAVVSYELNFLGLTPSFQATMDVHWQSVYEQFRKRDLTNFLFSSEEIDNTVEHLEESRSIHIEVRELDPAGASSATKALFDELKSQVIKQLFEAPRPVGDVPIEDRIGRGVRDVLTSILPGVSHTLRQMTQTELANTTIDINDQQVHSYPFYPQSTLAGMAVRAGGISDQLKYVKLDDLPFRVEEVPVEMAAGASSLGVKMAILQVQVLTTDRQTTIVDRSIAIDPTKPDKSVVRFLRQGTGEPVVRFTVDMIMDPDTVPDGRERWTFDWRDAVGQRIYFDPGEWLDTASIRFEMETASVFDLPASVMLDVNAFLADGGSPFRTAHFDFSKTAMSQVMNVIVPEGKKVTFQGKVTFRRPGEPDFIRDNITFTAPVYTVRNPFSKSWSMEIHAVADWTATDTLFGEMRVWDVARQLWLTAENKFNKDAPVATLRFATSPETPRNAEIRLTRVGKSGEIIRGPWSDLSGAVVGVSDKVEAVRRIRVTLHAPSFVDDRVKRVIVDLEYKAGDVDSTGNVVLTADGAKADWVHPFPDFSQGNYNYRVRASSLEGDTRVATWKTSAGDDLIVELPSDPS